ncbi:MAG TPA: quinone-dependent dihydroorotate dehydrogenase [Alphaproteobacteria bacterium]|nr:quinone-dependent dihydroorotate dehydrogenase [Alphaproteobacteria bacterium]
MPGISDIAAAALRCLPPETAHGVALGLLRRGLVPAARHAPPPSLRIKLCGLEFASPLGLAAGFDKDAQALAGLYRLGFAFVEAGTVTPRPQAGNARPRLFRLSADQALINRMGFNGAGIDVFAGNVAREREKGIAGPLGINIGANRDSAERVEDYVTCLERLAPLADYVTLNLSSPNTPGLRSLQEGEALKRLLGRISETASGLARPVPLLLKLAPELEGAALAESVRVAREYGIAGLILCNTTTARPAGLASALRGEQGGLSGAPLCAPALAMMREVYGLGEGRLALIGVGGIASAEDAYARIRAGAALLQIYTGFIYRGPRLIEEIISGLAQRLQADGFERVEDAVGADA